MITQLPLEFFHPLVMEALKNHFKTFGEIHTWAPLSGFARIIVVYYLEHDAELAKEHCDNLTIGPLPNLSQTIIRVYRADRTPIEKLSEENSHLRPPALEKNFLISPPGSPPVGWEPIREDPPNSTPLAEDLMAALRKLQIQQEGSSNLEMLIDTEDGPGISIYVEDCDADAEPDEEQWVYGQPPPSKLQWKPLPTALPPMGITA